MTSLPQEDYPREGSLALTEAQLSRLLAIADCVSATGIEGLMSQASSHGLTERGARVLDRTYKELMAPHGLPSSFQDGFFAGVLAGEVLFPRVNSESLIFAMDELTVGGPGTDVPVVAQFQREAILREKAESAIQQDPRLKAFVEQVAGGVGGEEYSAALAGVGLGMSIFLEADRSRRNVH